MDGQTKSIEQLKAEYSKLATHVGDISYRMTMLEVERDQIHKKMNDVDLSMFKLKNPEAKQMDVDEGYCTDSNSNEG